MNARIAVSAAKAERKLGATFRPFRETLADTVAWLRARLGAGDPRRLLGVSGHGSQVGLF